MSEKGNSVDRAVSEGKPEETSFPENMTYEDAIGRLEELLLKFEKEEPTLSESFTLYNEGIRLVEFCSHALDEVEQQLVILRENAGGSADEF